MIQDYQANKSPKEYWVNVYSADTYEQIYGWLQVFYVKELRETAIIEQSRGILYRIHIKMKEKKPKYDSFWTKQKIADYDKFFNMRLDG